MSVLTDPRYVVPPLAPGDGTGMDRLRRSVSRFSNGAVHAERRAATERALAGLSPDVLRAAARDLALASPPPVVPRVPLTVLAAALGVADPGAVAALVPAVAAAYLPGTGSSAASDAAADELLGRLDATRVGLLVQSCTAVATLVSSALARKTGLDAALASAPPVPATRRSRADTGETVTVPLDGIPFGEGPRRCPAEPHARALAAGILDALTT
jgi:hypothetical protein